MNCAVSHSFRRSVFAGFLLGVLLLLPRMVLGQSYRGSIRGKVSDPTGGLLAGAKITSKNVDTGLTRDGITNEEGTYRARGIARRHLYRHGERDGICAGVRRTWW